jgi:hypothetical protein
MCRCFSGTTRLTILLETKNNAYTSKKMNTYIRAFPNGTGESLQSIGASVLLNIRPQCFGNFQSGITLAPYRTSIDNKTLV